ncbi:MAG: hypothetical protein M3Q19_11045 [Pseudomonadota bacterium]|nr:hypothetical protein [Pseudomonadota bacterium]
MANLIDNARAFLESLQRHDLSLLLSQCDAEIKPMLSALDWIGDITEECVVISAPPPIAEALNALAPQDRKRIAEAVSSGGPTTKSHEDIRVETGFVGRAPSAPGSLLAELLIQRAMMIDVATGGARIQDVDDYYRAREVRIRKALPPDVVYDNPHEDLWDWYRYWSANLPHYRDRRLYIRQLFGGAIKIISTRSSLPSDEREPTGWERVDRTLTKVRNQLTTASAEEDFQAVGLLCREVIISLAQAVYDTMLHEPADGVKPSETDANRMLEAYIAHVLPGASYKEVRAHARASLALALNLQHRRTATRQLASLCLEATASTTAVISIIARQAA